MHVLAEIIRDEGELVAICPDCGLAFDAVKVYDLILSGGDLPAYLAELGVAPENATADTDHDDGDLSPIAALLSRNGAAMDDTIEKFGAEYTANWFFAVAAGIATRYSLAPTGDESSPYQKVTEETT